jgi:translocation and assembly module TamA
MLARPAMAQRSARARLRSTLASVALGSTLGCAAKPPAGRTALDAVDLAGIESLDPRDVRDRMASTPTRRAFGLLHWWWVDVGLYDPEVLARDVERIELLYRARGYRDARVTTGRVVSTGERSVRVEIVVDEGEPVRIDRVSFESEAALRDAERAEVLAAFAIGAGDPLDEPRLKKSAELATRRLTDAGFAFAKVVTDAEIAPDGRTAHLRVRASPGRRCTFGATTLHTTSGSKTPRIAGSLVQATAAISEGAPYSTATIRAAQNALFDLGVFANVQIEADLTHPEVDTIPVRIVLTEAPPSRPRLAPRVEIDPLRTRLALDAGVEAKNLFGRALGFALSAEPYLRLSPGYFAATDVRMGLVTRATVSMPAALEPRTTAVAEASYGVRPDPVDPFSIVGLRGALGLRRRLGAPIELGLFYRRGYEKPVDYAARDLPPNVRKADAGFFELLAKVDTLDDPNRPRRGYSASLSAQLAIAGAFPLAGSYGDLRIRPEVRLVGPIASGITLSFRFMVGVLWPLSYAVFSPAKNVNSGDPSAYAYDPSGAGEAPASRGFYGGGDGSNRGYPARYVGLRDCRPTDGNGGHELGEACSAIVGGATTWESSFELQFDIIGALSAVLFADMSDVSRDRFDLRLDYPHLSVGPGLRYVTDLGVLHLDFGIRVPGAQRLGAELDPRERAPDFKLGFTGPYALHLSMGEAF